MAWNFHTNKIHIYFTKPLNLVTIVLINSNAKNKSLISREIQRKGNTMAQNPIVTITMENGDVMKAELYPELAPQSVNNFISLINKNFYDGLIFHRVNATSNRVNPISHASVCVVVKGVHILRPKFTLVVYPVPMLPNSSCTLLN